MGNKLASAAFHLESHLPDLQGLSVQEVIKESHGRLLKTIRFSNDEGQLLVKIYAKRPQSQESLKPFIERAAEIKRCFYSIQNPNVFAWQNFFETDRAGYLLRQYFLNNLYDRIGTRPFLSMTEKKWIAFQLLTALDQAHSFRICHGDIKCENVLCTSWNWVFLADFASYKPTYIPQDDPADFSFYFDTGGRRTCYLAPERFYSGAAAPEGPLTNAMDIFSLGCVIAELFLEGKPIFDFSQLLAYRKGEFDPEPRIRRIEDPHIQELVKHMIQRDAEKRLSASEYLKRWNSNAFPECFGFLHTYIAKCMRLSSDDKVHTIRADLNGLMRVLCDEPTDIDPERLPVESEKSPTDSVPKPVGLAESLSASLAAVGGPASPTSALTSSAGAERVLMTSSSASSLLAGSSSAIPTMAAGAIARSRTSKVDKSRLLNATDKLIEALENASEGTDPVAVVDDYFEGFVEEQLRLKKEAIVNSTVRQSPQPEPERAPGVIAASPLAPQTSLTSTGRRVSEVLIVPLSLLCTCVHDLKTPLAKLRLLDTLSTFSRYLDDDTLLQRVIPYVLSRPLLTDSSALVRATALRALSRALELIRSFPATESSIFPDYLIPTLLPIREDQDELVREVFAETLPQLAETAKRFLETAQAFKPAAGPTTIVNTDPSPNSQIASSLAPNQDSFDKDLQEIQDLFFFIVSEMLTKDSSTAVKRALLGDISRLCKFFGKQKTNEYILPIIITFLNHKDWELRSAFFANIVGVSEFVGMSSLESFILPLTEDALSKPEEFVIEKALTAIGSLVASGMFRKHILFQIANKVAPMLCHHNVWIRAGVISIFDAIAHKLTAADTFCFLIPVLRPFLRCTIVDVNRHTIIESLKLPLTQSRIASALDIAWEVISRDDNAKKAVPTSKPSSATPLDPLPPQGDPNDPFDPPFVAGLRARGFAREEIETVLLMKPYLKSVSIALHSGTSASASPKLLANNAASPLTDEVDPYSHLAKNITVYSVAHPSTAAESIQISADASRSLLMAAKRLPGGLLLKSTTQFNSADNADMLSFSAKKTPQLDLVDEGETTHDRLSILPPPPPDLGALIRLREGGAGALPAGSLAAGSGAGSGQGPSAAGLGSAGGGLSGVGGVAGSSIESLRQYRPKGTLVAHFNEHRGAVNQVQVSPDNVFFVTGSDDGTVKIWDCQRLEKNVTNRSRNTFTVGGKVKCVAICENSHSVIVGSDNRSVQIFRVEVSSGMSAQAIKKESVGAATATTGGAVVSGGGAVSAGAGIRYAGCTSLKVIDKCEGGIVSVSHYSTLTQSLVVYATTQGKIHCWDLRAKREALLLANPLSLGVTQDLLIEPQHNWLTTGTSRGFLNVWDLRYGVPLRTWRHPDGAKIHKLHYCSRPRASAPSEISSSSSASSSSFVYAAAGANAVDVWDLDTGQCRQMYRVLQNDHPPAIPTLQDATKAADSQNADLKGSYGIDELQHQLTQTDVAATESVRAILAPPECGYLITGGTDKRIRFWDAAAPSQSYTISGLEHLPAGNPRPRYASHMDSNKNGESVTVFRELPSVMESGQLDLSAFNSKHPRTQAPSVNHHDCILDLKLLELPHRMLVSASRDGVVKVWK